MEITQDKFITDKEFKRLLREVSQSKTDAAIVDEFLFSMLWLTGMRISAALSLEWSDLHEGYLVVRPEHSKDGKKNVVYLGRRAVEALAAFRVANPYKTSPHLFTTQKGPMSRVSAHRRLKQWLKKSGLRESIHLHSFRHSFAVNALNMGVALQLVKTCLHHKSIATTSTYLSFTDDNLSKLKEVM